MKTLIIRILAAGAFAAAVTAPQPASAAPRERASERSADAPSGTINLNTATEDELQALPGVGPSKAAAIVAWRKKYGSFKKVDDLTRVKGFGRKTMQKLRPHLSTSGPTTFRSKDSAPPPDDAL